ncbi:hypothetical protein D5F01_LYC13894 [Larimichthys crocea]|uniref:DUF4585 domain-containing protein n=1 Tax=Larimichthys crocea TaxID=215358 RepID=A0A6G0I8Z8_LARCR|nr:hypothetical protein D5F01_LYC13894 [Larimichthys crocea]
MSTGPSGGRGERTFFLSTHRCPEVDLLPHRNTETQIPLPCSLVPAEKSSEFTCTGQSEANYLDVSSNCCAEEDEKEEDEEEEGSISDWSEEDLSLHFSPSVILQSDDEESDPDSIFKCVDITVETLVKGPEGEGLRMVPKRQIQLRKKKDIDNIINQEKTEKLQDGPAERSVANSEVSANEVLCPPVRHRPDLLLRQHSMPTSLHTHSTSNTDVDGYSAYRGLVAGASQGFQVGGNSRQRLQKSISLDETKAKMASCIIKSVLSKKMQVEQNNSKTSYLHKKPAVLPSVPQPVEQQRVREGGGGKTGVGVSKAPVHVVRDMRSLVKNTYRLSFSTAQSTPENNNKSTSFKVIGQDESPPPTYQQAVGVKGHDETKKSCQAGGHISKAAASLSQSQDRKQNNKFSHPITQQRQGSEPLMSRSKVDVPGSDLSELSQLETTEGVSQQAGTSLPSSADIQPPPHPYATSQHPMGTQPLHSTQEQSSIPGVSSQFAPSSSQQILHPCFYTPTGLPTFPPTLRPHLGNVGYMHSPLSYIQTQLQSPLPAPTLHLLRRSEENQTKLTGNTSNQPDPFIKTCPPHQTRTTGDEESNGNTVTSAIQEQHEQQKHPQQFLCSFLPAQVGNDFFIDMTGSATTPGTLLGVPAPCHVILDPKSGRCFYVDAPPQPRRKMLLDPETGQYVQVFLPAASSTPNTGVLPVRCANPTAFAPSMINPGPTVLSVMQLQPTVAMPSLYPPCLPFTLHTPSVNFTHTAP